MVSVRLISTTHAQSLGRLKHDAVGVLVGTNCCVNDGLLRMLSPRARSTSARTYTTGGTTIVASSQDEQVLDTVCA